MEFENRFGVRNERFRIQRVREKLQKGIKDLQHSVEQTQLPEALDSAQRSYDAFKTLERLDLMEKRRNNLYRRNPQAPSTPVEADKNLSKGISVWSLPLP